MMAGGHVGVIDIGKTNAKVALVDLDSLQEIGVLTMPNAVRQDGPYPHFDTEALWDFMLGGLAELHRRHRIDALTVTAHASATALLGGSGALVFPVLDYEHDGPGRLAEAYDALRPGFAETGSPRLAGGLNLGAQLFWQLRTWPDRADRVAAVVTYPQYWVWRLTGRLATEVTYLGCHTDLWAPWAKRFSPLVDRLGLREKMAPVRMPTDLIGVVSSETAARTGLGADTPVYCGIHDSNASLYPHLLRRSAPFTVVSTGTWVIAMAIGGHPAELDPARDTLINVNAFGDPVPSARFMGGREFEIVCKGHAPASSERDVQQVLDRAILLLPSVESRSGPFQGRAAAWSTDPASLSDGVRHVALSFYLALMTGVCTGMIGAEGPVITEGPFSRNRLYLEMLASALNRPVAGAGDSATGTSIGAALLTGRRPERPETAEADVFLPDRRLQDYATTWRERVRAEC